MTNEPIDVVVIGSGIGGLCCAALCARAGRSVLVLEAHHQPGGAAHGFQRNGFHFESGPSLWSGLSRWPSSNPLKQVLQAIGEGDLPMIQYRDWDVLLPEGHCSIGVGPADFETTIRNLKGPSAVEEWQRFIQALQPIAAAADALPLLALRPGVDVVGQLLKQGPRLVKHLPAMRHLAGAFGPLVDRHLQDPFLRNWVDLLCFLISGMPMGDTNAAAMATLFGEWFSDNACLDYPVGGSAAVVDALVRGLQRHGGELQLGCTVDRLIVDGERCTGVHCDDGRTIAARHVVSNADVWSTMDLVPETTATTWRTRCAMTPACASFLHLHLGFDASGLDDLPVHMVWVGDWERGINAPANAMVFSIPSVLDPGMAPAGHHVLHAYTPANEPWSLWKDLDRNSSAYQAQKRERCDLFWSVLEQRIPDIRERCSITMEGTPLTHRHFLHTHQGSYGPALSAAQGLFPGVTTPVKGLWMCGASTFPGIGIPPVAASGAMAAHGIVGRQVQSQLLKELGL